MYSFMAISECFVEFCGNVCDEVDRSGLGGVLAASCLFVTVGSGLNLGCAITC